MATASNVYYAKPVTVTDERVRDAMEKQAKQRALREALDSQVETRRQVGGTGAGLSKAQMKRQEVLAHQQELQRQNSASLLDASGSTLPSPVSQQPGYGQQQGYGQPYAVGAPGNGTYVHPAAANVQMYGGGNGGGGQPLGYGSYASPVTSYPSQRDDDTMYRQAIPQPPSRQPVNPGPRPGQFQAPPYEVYQAPPPSGGYHDGGDSSENVRELMNFISKATELPQQQHYAQNPYAQQQQQRDTTGNLPVKVPSRAQSKEAKNRGQSTEKTGKVALSRVEQLQKELADRQQEMQRMRDKERDWEQQVKQLKGDLKNARQKEKDLSKLVGEKPQRAETAPNPSSSVHILAGGSQRSLAKLLPLERQSQNQLVSPQQHQPFQSQQQPRPLQTGPASAQKGAPPTTRRSDFNNTKVYSNETFRPITAPLEPIADVRESTSALPPLPESLKMASFNTRKVAFGLPKSDKASEPVPLDFSRLMDFVSSQVVTKAQADNLWTFFAEELSSAVMDLPKHPTPPALSRGSSYSHPQQTDSPPQAKRSGAGSSQRQTYETYAQLDEGEGEGDGEYDDDYDEAEEDEGHEGGADSARREYYSSAQVAYR